MHTEWSGSCMFIFSNTLFVQQCGSDVCKLGFSLIHNNILEKVSKFQPKTANSFGVMDKNVEARAYLPPPQVYIGLNKLDGENHVYSIYCLRPSLRPVLIADGLIMAIRHIYAY